jgi:hypothetical protein
VLGEVLTSVWATGVGAAGEAAFDAGPGVPDPLTGRLAAAEPAAPSIGAGVPSEWERA